MKVIHDNFPAVKLLVTGSSSFELKNKMSDPLTGRYIDFSLYPLSFAEILSVRQDSASKILQKNQADAILSQILIYGFYPGIYIENNPQNKQLFLQKLEESYLFKDILSFERVRNSQAIKDLTKAIAYRIGSRVNENELANRLKIDRKTVVSYLDILEKSYVIIKVYPYSKNPRREIGRSYKIYFTDIGFIDLRSDNQTVRQNYYRISSSYGLPGLSLSHNNFAVNRSYQGNSLIHLFPVF